MAVAAPPERPPARKRQKSGTLPDGVEQFTLEDLFAIPSEAPEPFVPSALAVKAQPVVERAAGLKQLGFDSLAEQEPEVLLRQGYGGQAGSRKPAVFGDIG